MSKVEFIEQNEFHIKSRKLFGAPTTPTMIRVLLRTGIAKNEKQAVIILLSIIVLCFVLTFVVINRQNNSGTDTIIDAQGKSYTFDQYINLVKQGKDPLLSQ